MNCVNCGTNNSNGAIFCNACGRALAGGQEMRGIFPRKQNVDSSTNRNSIDQKRRMITMKSLKMKAATALLLVGTMMTAVTACGKSEQQETYYEDTNFSEEVAKTIAELDAADAEREERWKEYEETKEETQKSYKVYERDNGWDNVTPGDYPVQIDDVLYVMGLSLADTIKLIEGSEVNYEYEYNPDKIVTPSSDHVEINVKRDGSYWFTIHADNPWEESVSLSEILVKSINPTKAAMPYGRYIDGRSYDDILAMTYDEAKNIPELEEYYEGEKGSDTIYIYYSRYEEVDNAAWTGYIMSIVADYEFMVDANTGNVTGFEYSTRSGSMKKMDPVEVADVSELSDSMDELLEFATEKINSHHPNDEMTIVGYIFGKQDGENVLTFVYRKDSEGKYQGTYGFIDLISIGKQPDGKADFKNTYGPWIGFWESIDEIRDRYDEIINDAITE